MIGLLLACTICPNGKSSRTLSAPFDTVRASVEAADGDVCGNYPNVEVAMRGSEADAARHWTEHFLAQGFGVEERRLYVDEPGFEWTRHALLTHPDGHLLGVDTRDADGVTVVELPDLSAGWKVPLAPGYAERVAAMRAEAARIAAGLATSHVDVCQHPLGDAAPWWTNEMLEQRTRPGPDDLVPPPPTASICSPADVFGRTQPADADACATEAASDAWRPVFVEDPGAYQMPLLDLLFEPSGDLFAPDGAFTPGRRGGLVLAFVEGRAVCGVAIAATNSDELRVTKAGAGLGLDLATNLARAIDTAVAALE